MTGTTPRLQVDNAFTERFERWFGGLAAIGKLPSGGYQRFAWTTEDAEAQAWFAEVAGEIGLDLETDRNGNIWAWWGTPGPGTILTGSHLDSVANGGTYDGGLGLVSGLLAVDELKRQGLQPTRPIAVVAFADEEGGRYNSACFGSSLMAGVKRPEDLLGRVDVDGVSMRDALRNFGVDPDGLGSDPERVSWIDVMVELHVEQGRGLVHHNAPVGLATAIWPHGRWQIILDGEANHAGTTQLEDRRDPALVVAGAIQAAREVAVEFESLATIGKLSVEPNAPNAVPSRLTAILDARCPDDQTLALLVRRFGDRVKGLADEHGVDFGITNQSIAARVDFDEELYAACEGSLVARGRKVIGLPTAAGHDAGALASSFPTAMLFVRNVTGISHSPQEYATSEDCIEGTVVLAEILADLACR
ncbi:MAG: allantoate amidohydrolase [Acidimicrobiales bacterium]